MKRKHKAGDRRASRTCGNESRCCWPRWKHSALFHAVEADASQLLPGACTPEPNHLILQPHKERFHSSESQEKKWQRRKNKLLVDLDVAFAQGRSAAFLPNKHVMLFFCFVFLEWNEGLLVQLPRSQRFTGWGLLQDSVQDLIWRFSLPTRTHRDMVAIATLLILTAFGDRGFHGCHCPTLRQTLGAF